MILAHDDFAAIENRLGPENAAPIIQALEKIEREQKLEVKKDLLTELATKADLVELKGVVKADIARLEAVTKADIARLEAATKADIARLEAATKADIARLEGSVKSEIAELRGEVKRLEMLIKILIGLSIVAMGLFSPAGVELIKLIK